MDGAPGRSARARGFTIVEVVVVLALLGTLAAVASVFLVEPFRASRDMSRRARLVEAAESAIDRISREVRLAVPNTVRVRSADDDGDGDTDVAVEFLRSTTGGRYRRLPAPGGGGDPLNRALASDSFDVLGGIVGGVTPRAGGGRACADGNGDCLVVFNTGSSGFDAYAADNVAAITAVGAATMTFDTGGAMPAFPAHSARQRLFVLDTVVSYVCDPGDDTVRRHDGYGLNASQTTDPGGSSALLAENVTGCRFVYDPGTATRHGLLTLDLTLGLGGETVRLLAQTHVQNAP